MKKILLYIVLLSVTLTVYGWTGKGFELIHDEASRKVDVFYNGQLFTSYLYPEDMEKPVLYPIYNSNGTELTRGFPINSRPGERIDHPHHVGLWFNFGDVNGLDFWNNSYAIPEEKKPGYGSILHTGIDEMTDGELGLLTVHANWNNQAGKTLLKARSTYLFSAGEHIRMIEHTITLTAQDEAVRFGDSKEGLLGIRLDRAFEEVSDVPELRIDAQKKPMDTRTVNNEGVNGTYRNSRGKVGEKDTWGNEAEWAMVSAVKDGDKTSIAILDYTGNPGFPAHWHTRGYGLFSVNNMGSKHFKADEPEFSLTLAPGESVTFKHKVMIKAGSFASDEEVKAAFEAFNQ